MTLHASAGSLARTLGAEANRIRPHAAESSLCQESLMPDVKALEEAVQALPPSALAEFRRWFAEFDSAAWDRQLDADASEGRLDALLAEAEKDYAQQPRRAL